MPERRKLSEAEVQEAMKSLSGWSLQGGKLHREFTFADFVTAFGFMTSVALIAQEMDHHPDWTNVYNRVTINLTTHSEGGITGFDLEFARRIARLPT